MVVHWDDVAEQERSFGDIRAMRQLLGAAAGARAVGCSRWRIPAGARNAPAHVHADEEEIFYVLDGAGLVWREGRAYPVAAGDAIVFRVGDGAHTLFGGPIDVLAFGEGSETSLTWLPRANVMWAAPRWLPLDGPHPFEAEAALGPLAPPEPVDPAEERPPWIVGLTDVEAMPTRRGATDVVRADLGSAAGARRSGLRHVAIAPGAESHPPHCHSAEEELFVVLDGAGMLRLGDEELAVRGGSVVARPPGTGVAHSFRAGPTGLTVLAYGQRNPNDVCFYPRSGKLRMRGLGNVTFRVDQLGYWDGEE
jgi:uncharacterized cupin superfamily protein